MNEIYVYGRCLHCWSGSIARVAVVRHLPPSFKAVCRSCNAERQYAVTGQIVSTLSAASLRQIKGAQLRHVRVDWEQIPLALAFVGDGPADPAPGDVSDFHKPSITTDDAGPAKSKP